MKREIKIDSDWPESLLILFGIVIFTVMLIVSVYTLFNAPAEIRPVGGGSMFWAIVWTGLVFFSPSTFFRLVFATFALGPVLRAIAQFAVGTPEAMRIAAISASVLRIVGLSCLLMSLLQEARERVKIDDEAPDNA